MLKMTTETMAEIGRLAKSIEKMDSDLGHIQDRVGKQRTMSDTKSRSFWDRSIVVTAAGRELEITDDRILDVYLVLEAALIAQIAADKERLKELGIEAKPRENPYASALLGSVGTQQVQGMSQGLYQNQAKAN